MNKSKVWLISYLISFFIIAGSVVGIVVYVDPFMHYHKPHKDEFFYELNNQRSQNDGVIKHFEYNAVITGTSMTENFSKSEMDKIFEVNSIKIPYSGATYKELNDSIAKALRIRPEVNTVIRSLDMDRFFDEKDYMRIDLGEFPTYLYNRNPLDDVKYVFNRDVIYSRVWNMVKDAYNGAESGITSFDAYSNWMESYTFGKDTVLKVEIEDNIRFSDPTNINELTDEERDVIIGNITANVTSLADKYPNVDFYYFFPPYSAVWWGYKYQAGDIYKQIKAEQVIIEQILPYENIHLFSWNDQFDITTDLNNYKDATHYAEQINSWMLIQMKEEKGRITVDNYREYLDREISYYSEFDYNTLFD